MRQPRDLSLRGSSGGRLLPGALGRLDDQTLLEGFHRHADVPDFAAGQQRLHALQVRDEPALGDGSDVHTDTAFFLGLTRTPDVIAPCGTTAREFANS